METGKTNVAPPNGGPPRAADLAAGFGLVATLDVVAKAPEVSDSGVDGIDGNLTTSTDAALAIAVL